MLQDWIDRAIESLEDVGFQAERGYPATKIPVLHSPVIMVSLQAYTDRYVTLAADVFVPAEAGGGQCEETAVRVADVLTENLAVCSVDECRYAGKMGMFTVRVLARWHREAAYAVMVDGAAIAHVIACQAEKNQVRIPYIHSETGETLTTVGALEWKITITDLVPMNQKVEADEKPSFELLLMRAGGAEIYPACMWTQVHFEDTPAGVLRTRVAVTNQDRIVSAG